MNMPKQKLHTNGLLIERYCCGSKGGAGFNLNLADCGIELKSNLTEWQSSINSVSCVRADKGGRRMEDRLHSVSKM